ncbi:MAG: hypothetical protein ACI9SX_001522 [Pseudoalteromonas tetraodonis]|jgi:hypothetical protein
MTTNKILHMALVTSMGLGFTATTLAAVPNTFSSGSPASAAAVNQNFSSIDTRASALNVRIMALESAAPTGPNKLVAVDCGATPDFFIGAQFLDTATAQTTYDISGTCNGPVIIRNDDVVLNGVDGVSGMVPASRITIPGALDLTILPSDERYAISFQGVARGLVSNLTVDGNNQMSPSSGSGTIASNNSYVTLIDVRSEGSVYGIAPYRNSYLRAEGAFLVVDDFVNSGLAVGEQSALIADTAVAINTTQTGGGYIDAVESFGTGYVDLRGDVTINVPDSSESLFSQAIFSGDGSFVRVRNATSVSITGGIFLLRNSTVRIDSGTLNSPVSASADSYFECNEAAQTGDHPVRIEASRMRLTNCDISSDEMQISAASTLQMFGGTTTGNITVDSGSVGFFDNMTQTGTEKIVGIYNSRGEFHNSTVGDISANQASSIIVNSSTVNALNAATDSTFSLDVVTVNGDILIDDGSTLRLDNSNQANSGAGFDLYNSDAAINNSTITTALVLYDGSAARIFDTSLADNLEISAGSFASLGNVTQDLNAFVNVKNSRLSAAESTLGNLNMYLAASADLFLGSINGGNANTGNAVSMTGVSIDADFAVFNGTSVSVGFDDGNDGGLNSHTFYLCGNEFLGYIDGHDPSGNNAATGFAATGTVSNGCPP